MAGINIVNVDFSKLVIYGYLIHHQDPRILNNYIHPIHRRTNGAPYPAWLAMGNATGAATEQEAEAQSTRHDNGLGVQTDTSQEKNLRRRSCCLLLRIVYVVECVSNILLSIAAIAVTVSTAITMKIFSSEQSGRLVAMIILSVTTAISLSMTIYAMVAVLRKQTKPVHATSVVLFVLAIIQAIIISVSVRVTETDELNISRSLSESYKLATEDNPRHVKLWAAIQYDLECCGVYSPTDYRNPNLPPYFAPDVPISCCPGYDPDRSELVQERERQMCKGRKGYYDFGCRIPIMDMYRETAKSVIIITVIHIVLMVALAILGVVLTRKMERKKPEAEEIQTSSPLELPEPPGVVYKTKTNIKV